MRQDYELVMTGAEEDGLRDLATHSYIPLSSRDLGGETLRQGLSFLLGEARELLIQTDSLSDPIANDKSPPNQNATFYES